MFGCAHSSSASRISMLTKLEQFAIGECGMPMERARCPECQAPIGGQDHTLAEGVSRDTDMEQ